jgi:hypothetical protein
LTSPQTRRTFIVCGEGATLRLGPGDDFELVSNPAAGARVVVTGVNGDWSVVSVEGGTVYVRTEFLCAPTPAPAAATTLTTAAAGPTPAPANSTASPFIYSAPGLIQPTHGSKYWCSRELVLQWESAASLQPDEYFLVESKAHERQQWIALADWTKERSVTLHPVRGGGSCDALWWSNTGVYEWRVSIVRGNKERPQYRSPFSEVFSINYAQ